MNSRLKGIQRRVRRKRWDERFTRLSLETLEDRRLLALFPELAALGPHTALAYQAAATDALSEAAPQDEFEITLNAQQFAYLALTPHSNELQVQLLVLNPSGVEVAQASATTAGETVMLPFVPIDTTGEYTLRESARRRRGLRFGVALERGSRERRRGERWPQ